VKTGRTCISGGMGVELRSAEIRPQFRSFSLQTADLSGPYSLPFITWWLSGEGPKYLKKCSSWKEAQFNSVSQAGPEVILSLDRVLGDWLGANRSFTRICIYSRCS